MNIAKLNTASLDDKTFIIKRGTSGGSTPDTPTPSKPTYTGHADAEGLRAIGWTDEDIAYYQENGVNWNEEDDQYHLVTDDNKALYGVLTADNIADYKDRIVYLPMLDTSSVTDMSNMFYGCYALTSIPMLDTSSVTDMSNMFNGCYALTSIPMLDTSSVTNMSYMFYGCYALTSIPMLDTSSVTNMSYMFNGCYALTSIPMLDTSSVTNMRYMFYGCYSLVSIKNLVTNTNNLTSMFAYCYSLTDVSLNPQQNISYLNETFYRCHSLKNLQILPNKYLRAISFYLCKSLQNLSFRVKQGNINLQDSPLITKESLISIINDAVTPDVVQVYTITLSTYAYQKYSEDADVLTALSNKNWLAIASA